MDFLYDSYSALADVGDCMRLLASNAERILKSWASGPFASPLQRMAYYEVVALAGFTHDRPGFDIRVVEVRGETIPVEEEVVLSTDFCDLRRFRKTASVDEPKVLLVAPMSGHFATLLRGTLRTLLRDHEVYVTDWINPRVIPLEAGPFTLDDYTQHLIDFIRHMGPDSHIVAVCQPAVSALAATAMMAQEGGNHQPASLTLMAGPIDTRISPTRVNDLANGDRSNGFATR